MSAILYGDSKRTIRGVLPVIQELQTENIRLQASIVFLRILVAILFVMVFGTMLVTGYLIQALQVVR